METVTVSSKFRVTIPKSIRERLGLRAGQKLGVTTGGACIVLTPLPPDVEPQEPASGPDMTLALKQRDRS
jgi:AbrB family looped-hinge helix DNA binding protein